MQSFLERHWLYILNFIMISFLSICNANADIDIEFKNELSISQKQDVKDLLIISSKTFNLAKAFEVGFLNTSVDWLIDLPYGTPFEKCISQQLRSDNNFMQYQQPRIEEYVSTHSSQKIMNEKALFTPVLNNIIQRSFLAGFAASANELSRDQIRQEKLLLQNQLAKNLELTKAFNQLFYDEKYEDLRSLLITDSPELWTENYLKWSTQRCELQL